MKQFLFILVVLLVVSCVPTRSPAVQLGMTTSEFQKSARNEQVVSMESGMTIYKVVYGYSANHHKYYYFVNNKLVKVDAGRSPSNRIQIEHIRY